MPCQCQPTYILPISLMNQEHVYLGVCVCTNIHARAYNNMHKLKFKFKT